MAKTDAIIAKAKAKSESRENDVLLAIKRMKRAGKQITFYAVAKETGAAKSFLYGNTTIRTAIEDARASPTRRTAESKDVTIKLLTERIKELERENKRLASDSVGEKYKALQKENDELRKQLKVSYQY